MPEEKIDPTSFPDDMDISKALTLLCPDKAKRWQGWLEVLEAESIDTVGDVRGFMKEKDLVSWHHLRLPGLLKFRLKPLAHNGNYT